MQDRRVHDLPRVPRAARSTSRSSVARATSGLLDVRVHDPRAFTTDVHHAVDDAPFGGGAGMVMMPEPLFAAVEAVQPAAPVAAAVGERTALRPGARARDLAAGDGFSLLCGRYEGVDQRVADHCCDGELSVGDYVLAGGEAAALVVIEAVTRLVPGRDGQRRVVRGGVVRSQDGLVEYPQYTRPARFREWEVPAVLRSGDHARVARWRRAQSLRRTRQRRPDLLAGPPTAEEERLAGGVPARRGRPLASLARACDLEHLTMNRTDLVDRAYLRDDIPDFAPGDTLKVHVRVVEGTRERVQLFQGAVIRRQGSGARETFTVRKVSFGVGVERTFPVHSPILAKIEVVTRGDVRRAKLYYLRDRIGKAAKIKEKRF